MKRKTFLHIVESCAFLAVLCAALMMASRLVERKQSRDLFGGFLEEPELYDVLFFGDSQFMNGMIPMEMWEDYGIAGYNLSCYGNVLPISYWTMVNAFDYAAPKLVVLAVNGLNETHKVSNYSGDLHTAMDFWPLSANKARMIEDLLVDPEDPDFTDVEGNRYRDLKWEFYFTLGKYHSRWSELTKEDFAQRLPYVRGGESLVGVTSIMDYTLVDENDYAEESGYGYAYLRAAIEACQSRGVEVLLVHMPTPEYVNSQRHANTVGSIAAEYGVGFVDTTYLDSIVDYAVDCFDREPHLNTSGTLKMTDFLGSYIRAHYDLPDRRGDARYAHWNEQLHAYKDAKLNVMRTQTELNHLLMLLHDQDFDLHIAVKPEAPLYYDDQGILLMHNIARERVLAGEEYDKWSSFMYPLEGFDMALRDRLPYYLYRGAGGYVEYTGAEAESMAHLRFGRDDASTVMIEIIDRRTEKTAAQMRF